MKIALCSYPKTGRTWVRWFYAQYVNALYEMGWDTEFDLLYLNKLLPPSWLKEECWFPPHLPQLVAYHEDIGWTPKAVLIRRPGPALVSYYHHLRQTGPLDEFVLERLPEYTAFYAGIQADLFLHYEHMDFSALIRLAGMPYDADAYQTAFSLASFRTMQRAERKGEEPPCGWRVREGKLGRYRLLLREETLAALDHAEEDLHG